MTDIIPLTNFSESFAGVSFTSLFQAAFFEVIISLFLVIYSYKKKYLTIGGSALTFSFAVLIFALGGIKWIVPIFTFFILSSILSKFNKQNKSLESGKENSVRNAMQVTANGLIPVIILILNYFYRDEIFYFLYLSSIAAVTADTWSTETGTIKICRTYNILNFKPVPQGISGGISLIGLAGGIAGSLAVVMSSLFWLEKDLLRTASLILIAGFLGSLADSVTGSLLQGKFICDVCGKTVETNNHCGADTRISSGMKWIDNNMVNLFCSFSGAIFFLILSGKIFYA